MSWFFRAYRYLNRRDPRPLLPGGYHLASDGRQPTPDEAYLITMRYARTPRQARELLDTWKCLGSVVANVPQPNRKPPPRWQRLRRLIRRMFP